jgi:hypothetical protein
MNYDPTNTLFVWSQVAYVVIYGMYCYFDLRQKHTVALQQLYVFTAFQYSPSKRKPRRKSRQRTKR